MQKFIVVTFAVCLAMSITACGNGHKPAAKGNHETVTHQTKHHNDGVTPLNVKILTSADAFKVNKEGKMEIKVTKGKESVNDAEEVKFEIWKGNGQGTSKIYKGVNKGKGFYTLNYTFSRPGDYHVIAHVTAKDSHTMPEKIFHVKPS
ncbi:FixH family protein [Scopulibacillus cellulosilyticus]|uniref:FixH family protein n=1 Tax=Scopulibacillus cellulosilyticus TaxID=2665665 RepID=A0ABW2PX81_9BACL